MINPQNLTPDLIASDLYCGPNDPVGWILELDAVTGAVLDFNPGITCVVCVN